MACGRCVHMLSCVLAVTARVAGKNDVLDAFRAIFEFWCPVCRAALTISRLRHSATVEKLGGHERNLWHK